MLAGTGSYPADSAPLTCIVPDRSYEAEVSFDLVGEAQAGLLLFFNRKAFIGIGCDGENLRSYQYAAEQTWARAPLRAPSACATSATEATRRRWSKARFRRNGDASRAACVPVRQAISRPISIGPILRDEPSKKPTSPVNSFGLRKVPNRMSNSGISP